MLEDWTKLNYSHCVCVCVQRSKLEPHRDESRALAKKKLCVFLEWVPLKHLFTFVIRKIKINDENVTTTLYVYRHEKYNLSNNVWRFNLENKQWML